MPNEINTIVNQFCNKENSEQKAKKTTLENSCRTSGKANTTLIEIAA